MKAPLSPSSASSLTSSFDDLSLSTSTKSSSAPRGSAQPIQPSLSIPAGRASFSSEGSGFEVILVPQALSGRAESTASGRSGVLVSAGEATSRGAVKDKKGGKANARRNRKKKQAATKAANTNSHATSHSTAGPSNTSDRVQIKIEPGSTASTQIKTEPGIITSAADPVKPKSKTRRSGPKSRARRERAEVRELLDPALESALHSTPTARTSALTSSSASDSDSGSEEYSEDGASRILDGSDDEGEEEGEGGDSEDDENEVDGLSVLGRGSIAGTPVRKVKVEGSIMSTDDARSSIDSFISGNVAFLGDKANKLRLWQSLCIELGLVSLDSTETSSVKSEEHPGWEISTTSSSRSPTPTTSRSITPTPSNPFPETLNQAHKLLKKHAHVNLADYLEARMDASRQDPDQKFRDFSDLLHPTALALIKYTCKNKRFARLDDVKAEWLNPLLKTINRKDRPRGGA